VGAGTRTEERLVRSALAGDSDMRLGRLDAIANGEARGFAVPDIDCKIVVVRRDARVFAYLDSCPHYAGGTPMAWKTDQYLDGSKTHLACHSHGALFDIETGVCVLGPCLGQRLTRVAAAVDASGYVEVALDGVMEGAR
jgi:nitrite reductase/ring-hydroxylating ferredoxin subunit